MSKNKSELAQRHPIASTGELMVEHAKYNLRDDTFWRQVVVFEIAPGRKSAVLTLECGHKKTLKTRTKFLWEDQIPGTIQCAVCEGDSDYWREEERRRQR